MRAVDPCACGHDHTMGRHGTCGTFTCPCNFWRDPRPSIESLLDADDDSVLGYCPHGVNLDREFCPKGCRV